MSLNGLESPEVLEAYQTAIAEAGGWFLLKYASRDSVELLGRGKSGVSEARSALVKYEEQSPVYGVIVYRRRKVLIKYIPEGTSRVLLARTAVHFQDVLEKYSPYEALLEITSAEGLTDTTLAASFPLHTATPSGSSSRLRLDEITEDGEDPGPQKASLTPRTPTGSFSASQRLRMERRLEQRTQSGRSPTQSMESSRAAGRPTSPLASSIPSPIKTSVSQFLVRSDSGKPSITSIGSDSVASMAEYAPSEASIRDTQTSVSTEETSRPSFATVELPQQEPSGTSQVSSFEETRSISTSRGNVLESQQPSDIKPAQNERLSSSTRPSLSEQSNYTNDLFDFLKPKVKLGPRPVTASERAKRPLVATLPSMPATYRLSMRKQEQPQQHPTGQGSAPLRPHVLNKTLLTPPPIPDGPEYNPRPVSKGSIKSMTSHKSSAMTPDKLRLMKAVELRKRQLRKSNPNADSFIPPPDEDVPSIPKVPEPLSTQDKTITDAKDLQPLSTSQGSRDIPKDGVNASYKADSGIELGYEKLDAESGLGTVEAPPVEEPEPEPELEPEQKEEQEFMSTVHSKQPSEVSRPSTPPESLRFAIPGSFLDSASPDTESERTLGAEFHMAEEGEQNSKPSESSIVETSAGGVAPMTVPEEDLTKNPTIVMYNASRPVTPGVEEGKGVESRSLHSDVDGKSGEDSTSSNGLATAWEASPKRRNSEWVRKRQGFVEPLHVESETEDDSEDDLMEELQSAQLQEAKPIMVSRSSPVQQIFPPQRRPSGNSAREIGAVNASSPLSTDSAVTAASSAFERKNGSSTLYQPKARTADSNDPPVALKRNVSSEISKRIQALAGTSSQSNTPTGNTPLRPSTPDSLTFLSTARNPAHSRNRSFNSFTKLTKLNSTQNQITADIPQPAPSGPVWSIQHDPNTNRESVSVTARIVRPPPSERMESYDSAEADPQRSQAAIGHRRGIASETNVPPLQRIETKLDSPITRQDVTPVNSTSPALSRVSKEGLYIPYSAASLRSAYSPTTDDFTGRARSPSSAASRALSNDENVAPKEGSRTSRFFKRMSHIGGRRKSGAHQLADAPSVAAAIASSPIKEKVEIRSIMLPPVTIGDLNIQFPDSLLWKRRIVAIDDTGYVKFLPTEHQKATLRRFQLSEFRMPYVPDLDRQELQNSIMLDFPDGTTLQIACEDSVTHLQVTHVLKTYWRAWAK